MTAARRMYLDKQNAKLLGVCAGVADYFGWDRKVVRIGWVISTLIWPPIMITAYLIMAWLLDVKPGLGLGMRNPTETSMPGDPMAPRHRFADVKIRFDRLENRLRTLETVVTSRGFQMDRELRGTEPR
jgi:phage shock protein C